MRDDIKNLKQYEENLYVTERALEKLIVSMAIVYPEEPLIEELKIRKEKIEEYRRGIRTKIQEIQSSCNHHMEWIGSGSHTDAYECTECGHRGFY